MFKRFKYNFIAIFLVLLVGTGVFFNVQYFDSAQTNPEIISPDENTNDQPDIPAEIKPPETDNNWYKNQDNNLPSSRHPTPLINYCLEKLYNCDAYYETINFSSTISGSTVGLEASSKQLTTGYVIQSGEKRYEQMKFEAKDNLSLQFSPFHFSQATFTDDGGKTNHFWKTDKGEFDISKGKHEIWTAEKNPNYRRWYYDFLYPNLFGTPVGPIQFTYSNSQINLSTQKNKSSGRIEYIVSVKMTDAKNYPEPLMRSYNSSIGLVQYNQIFQNITFIIDKETGWITSYTKKDTFYGNASIAFVGADIKCDLIYTANFSNFNQNIEIVHPPIPEQA